MSMVVSSTYVCNGNEKYRLSLFIKCVSKLGSKYKLGTLLLYEPDTTVIILNNLQTQKIAYKQ